MNQQIDKSYKKRSSTAAWVEAVRLRTLPVSVAGVLTAVGLALHSDSFRWEPALICLLFAVTAQIASNFANEYFDFRAGLDRAGREGPRRGVTEGDITPRAMLTATFVTLGVAALLGLSLLYWGGWWLIPIGILILLGALAYSTGPFPLSHHGLGEVAVIIFFGIAPVTLTYWLQTGDCPQQVWLASVGIGLLGANVLVVNNYRDREDDRVVGKKTLAVILGGKTMIWLYGANALIAGVLLTPACETLAGFWDILPCPFAAEGILIACRLRKLKGAALTPMLAMSGMLMLIFSVLYIVAALNSPVVSF